MRAALGDGVDVDSGFRSLLGRFGLAVFLSGTGLTSDSRLQFDGLDLRSPQDDNRGTVLDGPTIRSPTSFPITETVAGGSISYLGLKGEDIRSLGGKLKLEIGTAPNAGAYLIQTGF